MITRGIPLFTRATILRGIVATFALLTLAVQPVSAAVLSASSTPSSISITSGVASSTGITWAVAVSTGPVTVVSTQGDLYLDGSGSAITLAGNVIGVAAGAGAQTVPITETLNLSSTLTTRIANAGGATYRRQFTDGTNALIATVRITVTTSGGGGSSGGSSSSGGAAAVQPSSLRISSTPTNFGVPSATPSTISVNWQATVESSNGSVTISSQPGTLAGSAGNTVTTLGNTLSRTVSVSSGVASTVSIPETIQISTALARRIAKEGGATLTRMFSDGTNTSTAVVTLAPTGNSAELTLQNLELRFDDDSLYRVVPKGTPLTARALVASSGNGILEGRWSYANPASVSSGDAGFTTLRNVRVPLAGNISRPVVSPKLPTDMIGVHIVRFSVDEPDVGAFAVLRYVVADPDEVKVIDLLSPAVTTPLSPETLFQWQRVPGASVYQVEFYAADAGRIAFESQRLAGVELPDGEAATRLRPFTLATLRESGPVSWRVVAYDSEGAILAASPLRDLKK